jgi:hypothetical protein
VARLDVIAAVPESSQTCLGFHDEIRQLRRIVVARLTFLLALILFFDSSKARLPLFLLPLQNVGHGECDVIRSQPSAFSDAWKRYVAILRHARKSGSPVRQIGFLEHARTSVSTTSTRRKGVFYFNSQLANSRDYLILQFSSFSKVPSLSLSYDLTI